MGEAFGSVVSSSEMAVLALARSTLPGCSLRARSALQGHGCSLLRSALPGRGCALLSARRLLQQAPQKQGDWSKMAKLYAENRGTFQQAYAHDCWDEVTSRPAVAPIVARATRVLDVGSGTGTFAAALDATLPAATIAGVDLSADMVDFARKAYPALTFAVADLSDAPADLDVGGDFDVATSTMVLHWPGPNVAFLEGVRRLLAPGGVFVAGLHGAGSCQEGVDAIEAAARADGRDLELDALPTMFRRDDAALWEAALAEAGFSDVDVRTRTVVTEYASVGDAAKRLAAAWPPILSGVAPDDEVPALIDAAARAMCDADGHGVMTSHLIEFSAHN